MLSDPRLVLRKFNFWTREKDYHLHHTAQSVLGLMPMVAGSQSGSCGQGQCNCGGGCNGECSTSCEAGSCR